MKECPLGIHFHVQCTYEEHNEMIYCLIEKPTPEAALNQVLNLLPANWEGGIEVLDDETLDASCLPLIDYWKSAVPSLLV